MSKPQLISVIITTYNWPEALYMTLRALNDQTEHHYEVIIVDDGSTEETAQMIRQCQERFITYPCKHLWQEDHGFRAARARNMGIQQASGDYIIFLDGDCIPQKNFIANHRWLAEPACFVVGHRIILADHFSRAIMKNHQSIWEQSFIFWLMRYIRQQCNKLAPTFTLPFQWQRYQKPERWEGAKTCNLAAWRRDLVAIDGFDENFIGWGYEDSDMVIRLINSGIKRKSGKLATEVFHLWHKEADRSHEKENLARLHEILKQGKQRAEASMLKTN